MAALAETGLYGHAKKGRLTNDPLRDEDRLQIPAGRDRHRARGRQARLPRFRALAEFDRDLIREHTQAGLTAARARGRLGGRPKALDAKKAQIAQALYDDKTNAIDDICRTLRISRATLYRYVQVAEQRQ